MKKALPYLILSCLLIGGKPLFCQQNDAVGTVAYQLEKKLTRGIAITWYNQYGFNQNLSELGYSIFDLGSDLKLNSHFTVGINYRYASVRSLENTYYDRQFIYSDLSWNKSIGNFNINARTRFVTKFNGTHFIENLNYRDNNHYFRNKIQVKYGINYNYSIFVATEQVYRLDLRNETEQLRLSGGVNYQFDSQNRLQLTYTYNQQVNRKSPNTKYITGLTYYFKF